jgi:LPXTG-motif cell wall-anchored protein
VPVRRLIAAGLAIAALASAPGAALAQSGGAGDDQYVDPFGGSSQQHQHKSGSGTSTTATGPALSSTPSLSASSSVTTTTPAAAPAATLPRTGSDAAVLAAIGFILLLAGAALRRRLRDEPV